jgi:glycosyltransferase involved in cell wall biosynthesis
VSRPCRKRAETVGSHRPAVVTPNVDSVTGPQERDLADGAAPTVDVVLPCLDEAAALPGVLSRMPAEMRVIVVDNGSVDATPDIASAHGALVVREERRGYGSACHAGLRAATADVVAFMDADGSLDPTDLIAVTRPIVEGEADLVVTVRRPSGRSAFPWMLRLANRELTRRIRVRTGVRLRDVGPMRAARREALLALGMSDRRSGYPAETVVRAADAGWRIAQVPVSYGPRLGRSKVTGTPVGAWHAVRDMSASLRR